MAISDVNFQDSDFKATLARAFDAAWEPFIAQEGQAADTIDNRRRLAARIVSLARAGHADEESLGEAASIYMRVFAETARLSARLRTMPSPGLAPQREEENVRAFGPEALDAMSTALDRCLDDLPLRVPSNALHLLSNSILDEAARGERDPAKLQLHALETLRSRQ
jgi:hypothetical protein